MRLAFAFTTLFLGGCSTLGSLGLDLPDTRIACTVAGDEAVTVMDFSVLRIAGKIDDRDRKEICK